jgi:hypothetical protein
MLIVIHIKARFNRLQKRIGIQLVYDEIRSREKKREFNIYNYLIKNSCQ